MLAFQKNLTNTFYGVLSLPSTAMGFALSIQIAALSWLLTTQYGLDIHDVGIVWAAGPLSGIIGQVLIGIISDNVWMWNGRRRPFIMIGGVLASLSLLALPNIGIISDSMGLDGVLGVAILVALTLDLSINVSFNPTRSIIADVTPKGHERTKGYTWMQTISGSFGVLAYLIGAMWSNYVLIYLGVVLVFVLSVVPPLFIKEPRSLTDGQVEQSNEKMSFWRGMMIIQPLWGFLIYSAYGIASKVLHWQTDHHYIEIGCLLLSIVLIGKTLLEKEQVLADGTSEVGFKKVLAAHSFTWIGIQSMFIYMVFFVKYNLHSLNADESGQVVNYSFAILSFVSAILPVLLLEPLARRFGRIKVHATSIASMAVGYFLLSQFGQVTALIYLTMALLGVGWAATISLPFAIMSLKVNPTKMGLYMGLFNLSVVLPQLVASVGVGKFLNQIENKNMLFIICGVCLALSALSWFSVRESKGQTSEDGVPMGSGH